MAIPLWLRRMPVFVIKRTGNTFLVDPDKAYEVWLERTGLVGDQYGLEVARRCFTEELHRLANYKPIRVVIDPRDGKWALKNFPPGLGADRGAAEFRRYFTKAISG